MSILSVDTIQPIGSGSTVTLNAAKIVVGTGITFESNGQAIYAGIITATSFSGTALNASGATGDFSIADSIVHSGDTNTKIRFPAADTVTVETAGSERLRITSGGDILLNKGNNQNTLMSNTSDGSDNQSIFVGGGGGPSDTRGAYIWAKGNEYTTTGGFLQLNAGNVGTAPITFSTGGNERARITSAGLVGIATNSPSAAWVDIATSSGSYDHIRLRRLSSDSNIASNWSLKPYGGNLYFRTGGSTDKIYFDDSGDLNIMDGNLTIATAGHGIDYSAQTAASSGSVVSEIMNHFSTGTIGVTLKAGSNTVPLYNNTMRYTRIGNICFVSIWIRVNGSTVGSSYSSSDTLKITGFPFAPSGNNDGRTRMRFNGYSFSGVSNKTWGWLVIGDGAITTEFELHWGHPDFSTITAPNGTNIHNSSSEIYINGHYFV